MADMRQRTVPCLAEFVLPDIPHEDNKEIPDPAFYLVNGIEEAIHQYDNYETNGKVYDVWYYNDASFPRYAFAHYRDDCKKAGFTVEEETIGDHKAYVIKGSSEVYIFPNYNDKVMFMIEKGTVFSTTPPENEWAYVLTDDGTLKNEHIERYYTSISLNQLKRSQNAYSVTIQNAGEKIQQIEFSIPTIAKAGDSFYAFHPTTNNEGITYSGIDPGVNLFISRYGQAPELYVYEVVPPASVGLSGSSDFLILKIYDVDYTMGGKKIVGSVSGLYKSHSEYIVIGFSVIIP